jgi:hypothetical protein
MRNLSLAMLVLAATAGVAGAESRQPGIVAADQAANAPPAQSDQDTKATAPNASPSKKLSESKGVIHPPPTHDSNVIAPPPTANTNKTVIPPPGTPGGDQSVQPK